MRFRLFRPADSAAGATLPASRRPGYQPAGVLVAVAAGLAAMGLPAAAAQLVPARPAAGRVVSVTPARGAAAMTVPLVTGDQVTVMTTAGGQPSYPLRPATGRGGAIWYVAPDRDRFVVPLIAAPYVGRELARSLFDVSALARDGITGNARIPVMLRFAVGFTPMAPPGVTVTSVHGESERGYLTAASGRLFAAALHRQTAAGIRRGHLATTGRLFGGMTRMSLAAPGEPLTAQPNYPLHILQLTVTDEAGQPASNVILFLQNTDNLNRELTIVPIAGGVGRIAVPAGDYSASAGFIDLDARGNPTAIRVVMLSDFTVPATSGVTTVPVDERTATSAISAITPRPATEDLLNLSLYRAGATGPAFTGGALWQGTPVPAFYVNAQPAAKVGRLRYVVHWGGEQPTANSAAPAPSGSYRYDVAFAADNIPANERFIVRAGQVATVHERFFADPAVSRLPPRGTLLNADIDPVLGLDGGQAAVNGDTMPEKLIQYLGTADGGGWQQFVSARNAIDFDADPHTFIAGRDYSLEWAHGPLAAGMGQHTGPQSCLACWAGKTVSLAFDPAGDSEPDHVFSMFNFFTPRTHFMLYRDGTKLFDASGAIGAVVNNITETPGAYRAVLDVHFAGIPGFSQSTATHTDLTVLYTPAPGQPGLPAQDTCAGQSVGRPCLILPALTLSYQMATNESNTSTKPVQVLHLLVGHVSYDGAGSRALVTSAAVSVSFDGGRSWRRATVTGSGGRYTATWRNPASARGTDPAIKVTASDDIGGVITQTITHAYTIGTASPNGSTR